MKDKKIILGALLIALVIVSSVTLLKDKEPKETFKPSEDAVKFKSEYEALNNTVRESDGATYNSITIKEDNPIKYVSVKEALDILKKDTAVLYVGAEWCPWCRNVVNTMFEAAEAKNIDTIYYLNLDDDKDQFEVKGGKLEKTVNGSEAYYELLKYLDTELEDYIITKDKKEYDTNEKRIYMPFVVVTKKGEIKGSYTGSVDLEDNQTKYDPLNDKQQKELYKTYASLFDKIKNNNICNDKNCD